MKKVKQVNLYNFTTRDFYTNEEQAQRDKFNTLEFYDKNIEDFDNKITYNTKNGNTDYVAKNNKKKNELTALKESIEVETPEMDANGYKSKVRSLVKNNELQRSFNGDIAKVKKVSTFTSTFTRAMGIDEDKIERGDFAFTDSFIVVSVTADVDKHIQNDIMTQLIMKDFTFNNKTYTYAFSGAGQIRTKKLVFVDAEIYKKAQDKLYAGLTDEVINEKGGVVAGKILAYKALSASASVKWEGFNIDECIVVKDFDHMIANVEVEHINWDYQIGDVEKKTISNPFMDGAGIMLESVYDKNVQFRAPWMKGLLSPFPFDAFIKLHKIDIDTFKVEDAWGNPQSLKGKKVIFTESQFKMRKYFDSWEAYKVAFKKYKCEFSICNEESLDAEDFKDCTVSYQMLQTLHNMTDDEIADVTSFTRDKINAINKATNDWYTKDKDGKVHIDEKSKAILLEVLGINTDFTYKRPFTSAVQLAGNKMLFDKYVQQSILNTRDSIKEDAKGGKLLMEGSRNAYMLPDFYAFCERLFLGDENPKGLLEADEVSCALYDNDIKLNLLRSPHLYFEHCLHMNKRSVKLSKWFKTNGVHVSINSTASHQLAADWDGDTSLIIPAIEAYKSSYTFVQVAERHMQNVKVLDYEMSKGVPIKINKKEIIKALKNSFKANIGTISNQITKVFNQDTITDEDLNLVKLLKFKNNLVIDFAKTNFDPKITDEKLKKQLKEIKDMKLPYFFKFAKDKNHKSDKQFKIENEKNGIELNEVEADEKEQERLKKNQVADTNGCVMNRICQSFSEGFVEANFAKDGEFDNMLLAFNKQVDLKNDISKAIINTYNEFVNDKSNTTKMMQEIECQDDDVLKFYIKSNKVTELQGNLLAVCDSKKGIVDVLVYYLYQKFYTPYKVNKAGKKSRQRIYKNKNLHMLWEAFGDILLENIEQNMLDNKEAIQCEWCEKVEFKTSNRQTKCRECAEKAKKIANAKRQAVKRERDARKKDAS